MIESGLVVGSIQEPIIVTTEEVMGPKDPLKVELAGCVVQGGDWVVEEWGQVSILRNYVDYDTHSEMENKKGNRIGPSGWGEWEGRKWTIGKVYNLTEKSKPQFTFFKMVQERERFR